MIRFLCLSLYVAVSITSCSSLKHISYQANNILLKDSIIRSAHIGISIYDPIAKKYLYDFDGDKYFVPASNTKLFSLYAGMKYLGDSLAGIRYFMLNDSVMVIEPTGDPSLLDPRFNSSNVLNILKSAGIIYKSDIIADNYLGKGWSWDDYKEYYMAQRSTMPVYGNIITIRKKSTDSVSVYPRYFSDLSEKKYPFPNGIQIKKNWDNNAGLIIEKGNNLLEEVPFVPDPFTTSRLLEDTLHIPVKNVAEVYPREKYLIIRSQPSDSLFKIMMHVSDNFMAEQTLLMAANENFGLMDDQRMIDFILENHLKDIPQRPKWVDGSGLSRYNLFTPRSFVYLLEKLKNDFGFERIKSILPTGGTGTLKNYYTEENGYMFAKTGTLSNHVALSGYLITKKNKMLIFSVIVNHFQNGPAPVRRSVEKFLKYIRENN